MIPAYTNEDAYQEKYRSIDWQKTGSRAASDQFFSLRQEYLSNKYKIQDYGVTFLILGLAAFAIFKNGTPLRTPSSRPMVVLLGGKQKI